MVETSDTPQKPVLSFANRETLEQLDWPWFMSQVQRHIRTVPAREDCEALLWAEDPQRALLALGEVEEARILLRQGQQFPLGDPPDIRPHQIRIRKGAILEPDELSEVASWMETLEAMRRFLVIHRQQAPLLYRHVETAPSLSHLLYDIRSCVSSGGEVREESSPLLGSLRRKAGRIHLQIQDRLTAFLNAKEYQDLLQDRFYTIKEERYVLPIKTQQKTFVDGIVLGSSNSGATLFIEPREIVELNNTHKLALLEIQNEIRRILRQVCEHLLEEANEIQKGERFLTGLDLIQAKAHLAEELRATVPTLNPEEGLRLLGAGHPILITSTHTVVPNDVRVAPPMRSLLITGPNTGGKTVILKMVGLFALMVRAGCPLPVAAGSNIPFFDQIFSDIGDDQSIQENRSSFSGHIQRIVRFLSSEKPTSLALLDEILISTDPDEGATLAQAILESLADRSVTTLATTHFLALKSIAAQDDRFQNASLGFHPDTLEPTYHLSTGIPGGSHALHIAGRIGLPQPVLARARSLLGASKTDLDTLLLQVEKTRRELDEDRQQCRTLQIEAEALKNDLARKLSEVESRERELKRKYRQRLEAAFQEAVRDLETWRRRRPKSETSSSPAILYRELLEAKKQVLSEGGPFHEEPVPEEGQSLDWSQARCGDTVYLPALRTEARILQMPDRKGTVTVETDGFRMQLRADQVREPRTERRPIRSESSEKAVRKKPSWVADGLDPSEEESLSRCDLRGLTVEEALDQLSRHLDRAFRGDLSKVSFIHGLGTGKLRNALREYLSRAPYPLSFRPGHREEGGDGVTVVEIDRSGPPASGL